MMTANNLLPVISIPTEMDNIKDTLTDDIFIISDHLPSFLIIPRNNAVKLPKNHNFYTRNMENFHRENCILDLIAVDKIASDNNVNCVYNNSLESTNNIIDKYIPSRKITKEERKYKRWITSGILKSNDQKIKLYQQFVK